MARLLNPITVCVDGLCWTGISPWFGFGRVPRFEEGVEAPNTVEEQTGHYTNLFSDASIVGAIHQATKDISDSGTRAALESGIASAVQQMEKRGGERQIKVTLGN